MTTAPEDDEHLRLLAIFHYVVAGIAALVALFPVLHLIFGLIFIFNPEEMGSPGPLVGWFFVIFSAMFICSGWYLPA